jgi:FkbM family methyltransferase
MKGDGPLGRLFWRGVDVLGVLGPCRARALAAAALRVSARSGDRWLRGVYRVSRRTSSAAPPLVRLPERWSSTAPVVRVGRLGLDLELDLRDNLQRVLYYTGTYEPDVLRFLRGELRRGDVVVDVGAHVGVHTLTTARRLRRLGGGRVIAFEPAADSAAKLRAAAAHNRLDVTVVERALGGGPGTAQLFADPAYDLADAGVRSRYGTGALVQRIEVTGFDAWAAAVGLDRLDLVKIDVEGDEPLVVEGMRESLRALRPRMLLVEVKAAVLRRSGRCEADLRDLLDACGYAPTGLVLHRNEVFRPASQHQAARTAMPG